MNPGVAVGLAGKGPGRMTRGGTSTLHSLAYYGAWIFASLLFSAAAVLAVFLASAEVFAYPPGAVGSRVRIIQISPAPLLRQPTLEQERSARGVLRINE